MTGYAVIIRPGVAWREKIEFRKPPGLNFLQKMVDGYIEAIPRFLTYEGHDCVAFCNEEGKMKNLPLNTDAQSLWEKSVGRTITRDHLVGNVVILYGDDKFMDAL